MGLPAKLYPERIAEPSRRMKRPDWPNWLGRSTFQGYGCLADLTDVEPLWYDPSMKETKDSLEGTGDALVWKLVIMTYALVLIFVFIAVKTMVST